MIVSVYVNSSILFSTGSSQNLLSPSNILSVQEDAKYKRISSEVMKHRLYESVVHSQRRRRFSARSPMLSASSNDVMAFVRTMKSMPVTPAHSGAASPTENSPTSSRRFPFRFLSRGATPRALSPEREESGGEDGTFCLGIASVLRPIPKVIRATDDERSCDEDNSFSLHVPSVADAYSKKHKKEAEIKKLDSIEKASDSVEIKTDNGVIANHFVTHLESSQI